jgi:hypothetical protein
MEPVTWFVVVFLVLLKIPAAYLCYVVWWAVKDPPVPGEDDASADEHAEPGGPEAGGSWWRRRVPRPPLRHGPHGSPDRRPKPAVTTARTKPPA